MNLQQLGRSLSYPLKGMVWSLSDVKIRVVENMNVVVFTCYFAMTQFVKQRLGDVLLDFSQCELQIATGSHIITIKGGTCASGGIGVIQVFHLSY